MANKNAQWFLNPACWKLTYVLIFFELLSMLLHEQFIKFSAFFWGQACWSDEDFIGRVCRTARRTHSMQMTFHTMTKSLMNYHREWNKICSSPTRRSWGPGKLARRWQRCAHRSRMVGAGLMETPNEQFFSNEHFWVKRADLPQTIRNQTRTEISVHLKL